MDRRDAGHPGVQESGRCRGYCECSVERVDSLLFFGRCHQLRSVVGYGEVEWKRRWNRDVS